MMFKIFLGGEPARAAGSGEIANRNADNGGHEGLIKDKKLSGLRRRRLWEFALTGTLLLLTGCSALVKKLPPANLQEPGWTLHEGQAVWRLEHGSREFAGEVLVATRTNGLAFVQFTKNPFPLVVAQLNAHQWQVEFPPQNRHYAGRGKPPKRLIWLYLPRGLAHEPLPEGWTWQQDASNWKLVNGKTGESLEGFFSDNTTGPLRTPKSEERSKAENELAR
jgi:hypothetical protein